MSLIKKLIIGATIAGLCASCNPKEKKDNFNDSSRTKIENAQKSDSSWGNFFSSKKEQVIDLKDGSKIEFVKIPGGEYFKRQLTESEEERMIKERKAGKPLPAEYRDVPAGKISSYYMSKTEITCKQLRRFLSENNSFEVAIDPGQRDSDYPYYEASYNLATAFAEYLSEKTGKKVALPTEKQWNYACMEGKFNRRFFTGETFDPKYGNVLKLNEKGFRDTTKMHLEMVGELLPNKFGIYDMMGNVREWVNETEETGRPGSKGGRYTEMASGIEEVSSFYSEEGFRMNRKNPQELTGIRLVINID